MIARVLAEAGLSILSAHVDGYGERAVDAFYVCDAVGQKLVAPRRIAALKAALIAVLEEEPGAAPGGRPRLERAPASVAR